jgi:hypothetical protein
VRLTSAGVAGAALLLALALLAPALVGERTVAGYDIGLFNLPALELAAEAWRDGHAPGWNPCLGAPYLADPSFYALDPRHLLLLLARPITALNLQLALAIALGFGGAWALGRAQGLSRSAALVAAASFGLGGVQASHLGNPTWAAATGLLPWALLAARRAAAPGAAPVWLVVAALPLALDLLGSAPEAAGHAWLAALVIALLAPGGRGRAGARLAAVALLAACLAAIGAVPAALAVADTDRAAGLAREVATMWSLHPLELPGLAVPGLADGGPVLAATDHAATGAGRPWLPSLYMGAGALVLALLAVRPAARRPGWRPLLLVGGAALLYALGSRGPLQPLLWELGARTFRYPAKAFVPAALVLALLAGAGLDLLRARPALARAATWWLGGLATATGACALAAWSAEPALAARLLHAAVAAFATAVAARRLALGTPRAARVLALVVLLDLLLAARGQVVFAPRSLLDAPPRLVAEVERVERQDGAPARVATLASAFDVRLDAPGLGLSPVALLELARREALVPNAGAAWGVRTATAFSSLPPRRLAVLRAALRSAGRSPAEQARLLGARLAVADGGARADVAALDPVAGAGPFVLGRVRDAPPWCGLAAEVVRASDAEAAAALVAAPGFDARARCVVEGDVAARGGGGRVRLLGLAADRLELAVDAPGPGLLVVREGWGAGWSATVDEQPAALLPADVLFRAVPVPAGVHRVALEYEAPGRAAGAALTGVTLLACLALAALGRRAGL